MIRRIAKRFPLAANANSVCADARQNWRSSKLRACEMSPVRKPCQPLPVVSRPAAWISDTTDWRLEDYMCTLPEGCTEFIAERKRLREQNRRTPKSN